MGPRLQACVPHVAWGGEGGGLSCLPNILSCPYFLV